MWPFKKKNIIASDWHIATNTTQYGCGGKGGGGSVTMYNVSGGNVCCGDEGIIIEEHSGGGGIWADPPTKTPVVTIYHEPDCYSRGGCNCPRSTN